MKAVQLVALGGTENLHVVDLPVPVPAARQVLIEVEAAGVIFADTLLRRGTYVHHPALPYVPGREVVGRIVAAGEEVRGYAVGQRVLAIMMGGGYAQYVAADVESGVTAEGLRLGRVLFPVGDEVDAAQAVSHGSNLRIAYLILHGRANAKAGQRVLLHAASGGVGAHLTRLAREHGLHVIALAGSPEKAGYCRQNGAHDVVLYKTCDYVEAVRELTGGKGVHLSINSVGADTLGRDATILLPEGELLITGKAAGPGSIEPARYSKSLTYKHFASYVHFGRPEDDAACDYVARQLLAPSHEDRIVRVPLDDVRHAHDMLEAGANFGKIVLMP
ncbi:quinone oxidoreductase family protein [Paraburkholderia sp. J12]|uniref:quinone oxidoreductase family protein n=1 Tax=Paraburkholderia sp. J12 TaxID=2805432 RepID=UPI002ABD9F21|nr:zinc-binding dehydrogenase [Paraburkholderia sp. J12]